MGVVALVSHGKLSCTQVCVQSWVISASAEVGFLAVGQSLVNELLS